MKMRIVEAELQAAVVVRLGGSEGGTVTGVSTGLFGVDIQDSTEERTVSLSRQKHREPLGR